MSNWINYAAEICCGKDGNSRYIRVVKGFEVYKNNFMTYTPFNVYLKNRVERGFMTEEEAAAKLAKTPWIKGIIDVPPQEKKDEKDSTFVSRDAWNNDVLNIVLKNDGRIYLSVKKSFSVEEGESIMLKSAVDNLNSLVEKGVITSEKAKQTLEKLSMKDANNKIIKNKYWLQFIGTLPPRN
jgi:hypothetical protein